MLIMALLEQFLSYQEPYPRFIALALEAAILLWLMDDAQHGMTIFNTCRIIFCSVSRLWCIWIQMKPEMEA